MDWIDTAAAYGWGHSEEIVGRALAAAGRRPLVFTKCGAHVDGAGGVVFDLSPDAIRRELEGSLARLGIDRVDLYQIHRPLPERDLEQGWRTLIGLRDEGLVRCIGVSNFNLAQLERIAALAPVETIQPAYSLMHTAAADAVLPYAHDRGIGVIVYSPMGSGLLTGTMTRDRFAALPDTDWRKNDARFSAAALARSFELAPRIRQVGDRHGASPGEVAVAWALRHPAVHGAIVGFRSAAQVDGVVGAAALELSDEDVALLERDAVDRD